MIVVITGMPLAMLEMAWTDCTPNWRMAKAVLPAEAPRAFVVTDAAVFFAAMSVVAAATARAGPTASENVLVTWSRARLAMPALIAPTLSACAISLRAVS